MKHSMPGILVLLFFFTGAYAQRVVETPYYTARNSPAVDIVKIELRDTATVIYCNATYIPKWWIKIPSSTYIQATEGGEKLGIITAEGITIDEEFWMPESGKTSYTLFFPPLGASTKAFDFIECPSSNCFNIYDISLREDKRQKTIPSLLEGDWFATSGSGEWTYGFYEHFAVFENAFWEYGPIRQKGKINEITLVKGAESKIVYAKAGKDGRLLMGPDKKRLIPFSREKIADPSYDYTSQKEFSEPVIRKGDAVIRGYIKGYSPKMGMDAGFASIRNLFPGEGAKHEFKIDKLGRFEVKVPLDYPGAVHLNLQQAHPSVFVEPGSETLWTFELDEFSRSYSNSADYLAREKTSTYMGSCAAINADIQRYVQLLDFGNEDILEEVLALSPEQYKSRVLAKYQEKQSQLKNLKSGGAISLKAYQYLETSLNFKAINTLIEIENLRGYAHYLREKDKPDSLQIPLQPLELDKSYYSFMQAIPVNFQLGLLTTDFSSFIDNVRDFRVGEAEESTMELDQIEKLLEERGVRLTDEEVALKGAVASIKGTGEVARKARKEKYDQVLQAFVDKYSNIVLAHNMDRQYQLKLKIMQEYLGVEDELVLDIVMAQNKINIMEQCYLPLSDKELQGLDQEVKTSFVKDYIENYNAQLVKELAEVKDMSGVIVNKTPLVESEKLFDAMIEKYKGKVVYVDFWATWCGPCMKEMPYSKKLKEELDGTEVVFLYITNESSPLKAWTNKLPEIKGEHFRLRNEDWQILSQKFNVLGIPHYLLIDQEGQVVSADATRPSHGDELIKEIHGLLEKEGLDN